MSSVQNYLTSFGGRIRVRACGLLLQEHNLLLIRHKLYSGEGFWLPPGGGIEPGETPEATLQREFMEECGLRIEVGAFAFLQTHVAPPLHALELYFWVSLPYPQEVQAGHDPELGPEQQLLEQARWLSWAEIEQLPPPSKPAWLASAEVFRETCLSHGNY